MSYAEDTHINHRIYTFIPVINQVSIGSGIARMKTHCDTINVSERLITTIKVIRDEDSVCNSILSKNEYRNK